MVCRWRGRPFTFLYLTSRLSEFIHEIAFFVPETGPKKLYSLPVSFSLLSPSPSTLPLLPCYHHYFILPVLLLLPILPLYLSYLILPMQRTLHHFDVMWVLVTRRTTPVYAGMPLWRKKISSVEEEYPASLETA